MINANVYNIADVQRTFTQVDKLLKDLQDWEWVPQSWYSAYPMSNKTIRTSTSDGLTPGKPVYVVQDNVPKYAIATGLASNTLTIAGAPLDTARPIQALLLGSQTLVVTQQFVINGAYSTATAVPYDCLRIVGRELFNWGKSTAYLVKASVTHIDVDATTQPVLNIANGGNDVFASNITLTTGSAWVDSGVTDAAYYQVELGDAITVPIKTASTGGSPAEDLTVSLQFVME